MNLLNKLLCSIGWHKYEYSGLVPTGEIDPWGCPTYWLMAIHKCKYCSKVKK